MHQHTGGQVWDRVYGAGVVGGGGLFLFYEKRPVTTDDESKVNKMEMEDRKPVARFKAGMVSGAIFENEITVEGKPVRIYKVSIGRRYRDRYGGYKTSQNYSRQEIPLAMHVLQKSFEWMLEHSGEQELAEVVEEKVL